jgi:hypothetical protein
LPLVKYFILQQRIITICVGGKRFVFVLFYHFEFHFFISAYNIFQYPTSNYLMTEIGYHTDNFTDGVTETAAGILIVNTLLSGLQYGFSQTYIYELWDETWAGYDGITLRLYFFYFLGNNYNSTALGPESHFGLFNHDETPKPAAKALHFLSQLLSDSGTPAAPSTSSFILQGTI